jgi:transcriptional regulator with XRE-family HTH domain
MGSKETPMLDTPEAPVLDHEDIITIASEHARQLNVQEARALCQPLFDSGLSQAKLARELGISKALVTRWLDGTRQMTLEQVGKVFSYLLDVSTRHQAEVFSANIAIWLDTLTRRRKILYRLTALLGHVLDVHYTRAYEGMAIDPELRTCLDDICTELGTAGCDFARLDNLIALSEAYPALVEQVREARAACIAQGQPFSCAIKVEDRKVHLSTEGEKAPVRKA